MSTTESNEHRFPDFDMEKYAEKLRWDNEYMNQELKRRLAEMRAMDTVEARRAKRQAAWALAGVMGAAAARDLVPAITNLIKKASKR